MLQGLATKVIINQVIKALEKVSDKRIASDHEKRIMKLEKMAHAPADFVCTECGSKAKRKSNNKRRK